ncbi:MAG TPA: hypothetical protein DCP89_01860 [Acidimicrobiaceae bacterium]|jgi:hypothetical protein|nr:hypothetical protein [Actinomycetota bacterium]HAN07222.1 hypothetical protein [Acidimicrobiaceae bacterium]
MHRHLIEAATEGLCSDICARNPTVRVELLLKELDRWVTFRKNYLMVAAPAATVGRFVSSALLYLGKVTLFFCLLSTQSAVKPEVRFV